MDKLITVTPRRGWFEVWDVNLHVQVGPPQVTHNDGVEYDVYVNGECIGRVERIMKSLRPDLVEGWNAHATFPGRAAEAVNRARALRRARIEAMADLINSYTLREPVKTVCALPPALEKALEEGFLSGVIEASKGVVNELIRTGLVRMSPYGLCFTFEGLRYARNAYGKRRTMDTQKIQNMPEPVGSYIMTEEDGLHVVYARADEGWRITSNDDLPYRALGPFTWQEVIKDAQLVWLLPFTPTAEK